MGETLAVPWWLALAAGLLAAWALYEHVLMPALRWMVMHPANHVIDDVSTRLRIGIRPFQRTRRQALIHRLLTDPEGAAGRRAVRAANRDAAAAGPASGSSAMPARSCRRSTPTSTSAPATGSAARVARLLYRVRMGYVDGRRPRAHRPERHRGVRHEPPLQHGLRARRLPRRRPGRAVLRGGRMGAHLAAVGADPRDGRLLRAAQFARRALPPRARALHRHGDRGRRAAGGVSRRAA